ncbi:Paraneoplastic antigen Ma1 [Merluccius polli]|uniref:Paraneoplastic antigen Ma1 n=1 Tax=Merluccius polli TaxID=89951 RepID=A0AA47P5G7_MERPO|nr:Paraneoplastic antigen Ma1 [Merluccius polli]
MDVIKSTNIKVQNSLIISGSLNVESDKELVEHLKQHCSIARFVSIDAPNTKFHEQVVVEYTDITAIQSLKPLLPATFPCQGEEGACHHLSALVDVYAPEVSSTTTETYLEQLQVVAQATGKSLEELLATELDKLNAAASPSATATLKFTPTPRVENSIPHISTGLKSSPNITINDINPPDIQRVVVEHIVRNADAFPPVHTSNRLRSFSGKCPHPNSEVDYETWRANVELILKNPAISDLHRARKILESLLSPAADIVKQLGPQASPTDYLQLLDSAFGTVDDGEELFAKFMNTLQDAGEKPSHYLNRLQVILSQAVKRGGVAATEQDEHLLRQFCRGCWDGIVLTSLQLEQRKHNPPSFPAFLLLLRTEEDRQAAKAVCMSPSQLDPLVKDLKRQIAELQSQMAALRAQTPPSPAPAETNMRGGAGGSSVSATARMQHGRPRPWYCFRCGVDGHIAPNCSELPNQALVTAKKQQLQERQQQWEAQNSTPSTQSLN